MNNRKSQMLLGSTSVVVIVTGLVYITAAGWRQQDLDYNLTDAVGRRDVPQVRRLLDAGANPNAQWSGYDWRWKIRMMFDSSIDRSYRYTVMDRVNGDAEMEGLLLRYLNRTK